MNNRRHDDWPERSHERHRDIDWAWVWGAVACILLVAVLVMAFPS